MTELLLHKIWAGLYFNTQNLKTLCGRKVSIINQGTLNTGDGPDFRQAQICIDDVSLFGDIELHLQPQEWFHHGHHKDSRYKRVVLHVILSEKQDDLKPATLSDKTTIPTLNLQPYLSGKLNDVLNYTTISQGLKCSGMLHLISPDVLEKQIDKAHKAYFEYRVDHLMKIFDPALPPSQAWEKMFIMGLFEGLGVSRNTTAMITLCDTLYRHATGEETVEDVITLSMSLSGLCEPYCGMMDKNVWDFSGTRPANQPRARIKQASELFYAYKQTTLSHWLTDEITEPWNTLFENVNGIGIHKKNNLYATVYLPALYILGKLFCYKLLTDTAYTTWINTESRLPEPVLKNYKQNGFPDGKYKRKLGAVYQYKYMCRNSCCDSCFVMQKLLQA